MNWDVSSSDEAGHLTLNEQKSRATEMLHKEVKEQPLVKAVLEVFPDAIIEEVEKMEGV